MAEYDAGSVFAQVVPSFRGAQTAIKRESESWGRTIGTSLSDSVSDAVPKGVEQGTSKAKAPAAKGGAQAGGAFASAFQKRVRAALESLPEAKIDADASEADQALARIRSELAALADKQVGVDIDAGTARAELARLQAELTALSSESADVQVRADTATASAQLAAFESQVEKLDGRNVRVDVGRSTIDSFKEASTSVSLLSASIVPLGTLAAPVLAATAGGAVALGGALTGAVAGVGALAAVAVPAFTAISDVSDAQDSMNKAIATYGPASSQAETATKKYQAALGLLTPAQRELATALDKAGQAFTEWSRSLQPAVLPLFSRAVGMLKPLLESLTPVVKGAAAGFGEFLGYVESVAASPWMSSFAASMGQLARVAIPTLGAAIGNIIQALGNLFIAFQPLTVDLLHGIEGLTARFRDWSATVSQSTGFQQFLDYVRRVGPMVIATIGSIVAAVGHIVAALAPFGPALLTGLKGFADLIRAMPAPVIAGIALAVGGLLIAIKGFGLLAGAAQFITALPARFKMIKDAAALCASGVKSVVGGIRTMVLAMGRAIAVSVRFIASLVKMGAQAAFAAGKFLALKVAQIASAVATGVVTAAQWVWNAALTVFNILASPITLTIGAIIAAIAALVAGIYFLVTNWTTVWNAIKTAALAVWGALKTAFSATWNFIRSLFTTVLNAMRTAFTASWNFIRSVAVSVWNAIASFFTGAFTAFVGFFRSVWNGVLAAFRAVWNWIRSTAIAIWNGIAAFFSAAFTAYRVFFTAVWNGILTVFRTVWNWIKTTAMTIWNAIRAFFVAAFNSFKAFFTAVWNGIVTVFRTVWNWIRNVAVSAWNGIRGFFVGAFNAFTGFFRGIWDGIVGIFETVWGKVTGIAQKIWDGVVGVFKGGVNAVLKAVNWLSDKVNKVLSFFHIPTIPKIKLLAEGGTLDVAHHASGTDRIGSGFVTNGPQAIVGEGKRSYPEYVIPTDPAHRGRASSLYQSLGTQLGMPGLAGGGILDWIGGAASTVWGGIKSVASKVGGWIADAANWVGATVGGIWDKIKGTITGMLPANVFADIGSGTAKKLISGVIDKVTSMFSSDEGGASVAGARPAMQWAPVVHKALAMLGLPQGWAGRVLQQIQIESGGNPNAVNNWDINAQNGTPSKGLLQTIGPTFRANMYPGHGNILAPLDNILAAIRYAMGRYGSLPNIWPTRAGYDQGGWLMPGATMAYNGTGRAEAVLTQDQLTALLTTRQADSGNTVNVYARTDADPAHIAHSVDRHLAMSTRL